MDKMTVNKITHIIGERISWNVYLNPQTDLSNAEVSFRGTLNDKTPYEKNVDAFKIDNFTVSFRADEMVNENADKKLEGRFYFKFSETSVRVSTEILIVVKR